MIEFVSYIYGLFGSKASSPIILYDAHLDLMFSMEEVRVYP